MSKEVSDFIMNEAPANQEFDKWLIQVSNQQDQLRLIKEGVKE